MLHEGQRRLLHPPACPGGERCERREAPAGDAFHERSGVHEQEAHELVVGPDQALAGNGSRLDPRERRPGQRPGLRQLRRRAGGAERGRGARGGPGEQPRPARSLRVADHRAAGALQPRGQGLGRQPPGDPVEVLLPACQGRGVTGHAPGRRARRRPHVGLVRRRVAQQQGDQLPPPPLAFSLQAGAGLGVALHRVGRELVDVGEGRLGQEPERGPVDPGLDRGRRELAPRHARPHAVGGLERVEGTALAQLAAPERPVHLAARGPAPVGVADQRHELPQRLGHAGAHPVPERPLERPRVLRHLPGDGGEDLVGGRAQGGLDGVGRGGGQVAPGLGGCGSCHSGEQNRVRIPPLAV